MPIVQLENCQRCGDPLPLDATGETESYWSEEYGCGCCGPCWLRGKEETNHDHAS